MPDFTVCPAMVDNAMDALAYCADGDWEAEIRMYTGQIRQAGTIIRNFGIMFLLERSD